VGGTPEKRDDKPGKVKEAHGLRNGAHVMLFIQKKGSGGAGEHTMGGGNDKG